MLHKPTKEEIKSIYKKLYNDPGNRAFFDEQQTHHDYGYYSDFIKSLMGASCGVTGKTVTHWLSGHRNCPPACWRCLMMDYPTGDKMPIPDVLPVKGTGKDGK